MNDLMQTWIAHANNDFPRMVGHGQTPYQTLIRTQKEYIAYILDHLTKDVFISVHNADRREQHRYNKLYFDIDSKDLKLALRDARKFSIWLTDKKHHHRIYFSGSKGFAFYVDFDEIIIKDYRDRMDAFLDLLKKDLKITTFDRGVCGDRNRISRIPSTINTKSNKLCYPVENIQEFTFDRIKSTFININPSPFGQGYLKITYKKKEYTDKPQTHQDVNEGLKYILKHANNIKDGAANLIWTIIIPSMAVLGASDTEIEIACLEYATKNYLGNNHKTKSYISAQLRSYRNRSKEKFIYPMRLDTFRGRFDLEGI